MNSQPIGSMDVPEDARERTEERIPMVDRDRTACDGELDIELDAPLRSLFPFFRHVPV